MSYNTIYTTIDDLINMTSIGVNEKYFYTTDDKREGMWEYIETLNISDPNYANLKAQHNIGTIIVSVNDLVFKRIIDDGIINVCWFGAGTGDRTDPDDTISIQNALNYVSDTRLANIEFIKLRRFGGKVLYFPEGEYIITDTLLIGQNTTIRGVSKGNAGTGGFPFVNQNAALGSVIKCNFVDKDKWAISSATYKKIGENYELIPIDKGITGNEFDNENIVACYGIVIENMNFQGIKTVMVDNCSEITTTANDVAYGCIRLLGSPNSLIRNCGMYYFRIGTLLSGCWQVSLENNFSYTYWYGLNLYYINSLSITGSHFLAIKDNIIIPSESLPNFVLKDIEQNSFTPITKLDKLQNLPYNSAGIYAFHANSVSISGSVAAEGFMVGMFLFFTNIACNGIYIENIQNISVVSSRYTNITINDLFLAFVNNIFCFGLRTVAKIQNLKYILPSTGNQEPWEDDLSNLPNNYYIIPKNKQSYSDQNDYERNIIFENCLFNNNKKRIYDFDIQFVNDLFSTANFGGVAIDNKLFINLGEIYIDPDFGNDQNFGFHKYDALKTFNEALHRVNKNTTINPVKKILIKSAKNYEGDPVYPIMPPLPINPNDVTIGAVNFNNNDVEIENCNILITNYDIKPNTHDRARLYLTNNETNNIGSIIVKGNVNLVFRDVEIYVQISNEFTVNGSFFKINYSTFNISIEYSYNPANSLNPLMMPQIDLHTTSLFTVNYPAYIGSSILKFNIINCFLVNGELSPNLMGHQLLNVNCIAANSLKVNNGGWNDATIIYNNF